LIWPPPDKPLEGALVRLEPARREHRDGLLAAAAEAASWEWMNRRIPGDAAEFDRWLEDRMRASAAGEEWCFVTTSVASGSPIGSSSYLAVRPPHDGLEIGWTWLHPSAWRTGANREAKLLMLGFAFDELGCMRVEFKTDARNERSRAALEGIGATYEGTFRKHMLMAGIGVRDSAYFSITDEEWPAVRERLTASLSTRGEAVNATA
jgi:RimJ/RimL family protein N-acetyltransferase